MFLQPWAGSTGKNPEIAISAMGVALNTEGWFYMISVGLGSAAGTRVANELGAGRAADAKLACCVSILICVVMQAVFGIAVWFAQQQIVRIFTKDPGVVRLVNEIIPVRLFSDVRTHPGAFALAISY
jgi:MATE family multidrug resistance protein